MIDEKAREIAAITRAEAIEAEISPMSYEGADLTECVERITALFSQAFEAQGREIERLTETIRQLRQLLERPAP